MDTISIGINWAWIIAANEAVFCKSTLIEPEHLLLGIFKITDASKDLDKYIPDLEQNEKTRIIAETKPLLYILEQENKIRLTELRRSIRLVIQKQGNQPAKEQVNRSEETKKVFDKFSNYIDFKGVPPTLNLFLLVIFTEYFKRFNELLSPYNIDINKIINDLKKGGNQPESKTKPAGKDFSQFGRNLTQLALENKLSEAIGRDTEIRELGRILLQKTKPNALIIGEAGVGKTAIVESFAIMCAKGNVPEGLKNRTIFELSISSLIAGAKYRGDFEDRLNTILQNAIQNNIILFIDEFHNIMGAGGGSDGLMDASNILKPFLARGDIQLIGATTITEYRKYVEKDAAIERRFQLVHINEPDVSQTISILKRLIPDYENHYKVKISQEAIDASVKLSITYLPALRLPDKAISILESACSRKLFPSVIIGQDDDEGIMFKAIETEVTEDDVFKVISKRCNIPVEILNSKNSNKFLEIEKLLKSDIIGQDQVMDEIGETIRMIEAGLGDPGKPKAVFLFVGPTGVGKTATAISLARHYFGSENNLLRFDMSEYHEKHHIDKFIGAPPGYIGSEDEGLLIKKVRTNPTSVVLFDEIEKAHHEVQDIFLQILDNGILTASNGRTASFKDCVIIFTSNLGTVNKKQPKKVGFNIVDEAKKGHNISESDTGYISAVNSYFKPEFINRLNKILIFKRIGKNEIGIIIDKLINELNRRLLKDKISVVLNENAKDFIIENGYNEEYGVRHLSRTIDKEIAAPISKIILVKKIKNTIIKINLVNKILNFETEPI
ncbi:MAG: ATP-dependent Clp protease ATP-binding subunit [Bacteroidales bacterium]|nr:ATP-dependent Clp protease ATP-binding subunit [Bacteroidales bacterium]